MLLVTGITGHSGSFFLKELIKENYTGPIRCLIRETSNTSLIDKSGLNIEKVVGDLNKPVFINEIMSDVQTVLHIYNIHHSPILLEHAIKNNVERVILVHTTGIYSNYKSASWEYKQAEKKVFELINNIKGKTSLTILRPTMIYGDMCDNNMSKFIKLIDKVRIVPIINGGTSLIQPINARDLGKAYYNVLKSPKETSGKAYDLSGEYPIEIIEVLKLISNKLNKKTFFINIPLKIAVILSISLKKISFNKFDIVEKIQRMGEDRSYSHLAATKDFDFVPMKFESGIDLEVKQYKKLLLDKRN